MARLVVGSRCECREKRRRQSARRRVKGGRDDRWRREDKFRKQSADQAVLALWPGSWKGCVNRGGGARSAQRRFVSQTSRLTWSQLSLPAPQPVPMEMAPAVKMWKENHYCYLPGGHLPTRPPRPCLSPELVGPRSGTQKAAALTSRSFFLSFPRKPGLEIPPCTE